MNYPERFERAINKLVKAFFDGELLKGFCDKCAVGNICNGNTDWSVVFATNCLGEQDRYSHDYCGSAKVVIDSTGYTWQELARVEFAFENAEEVGGWNSLQSQFNGLMAVVDVLCDIEGIEDSEPVKDKFKPKLQEA